MSIESRADLGYDLDKYSDPGREHRAPAGLIGPPDLFLIRGRNSRIKRDSVRRRRTAVFYSRAAAKFPPKLRSYSARQSLHVNHGIMVEKK